MAKEIPASLRAESGNNATAPRQEARDGMLGRFAQMRLEFAEGQFDRVEVRRILREINQRRARRFDRLRDAGDLVDRQIVHGSGSGIASHRRETSARSWLPRSQMVR